MRILITGFTGRIGSHLLEGFSNKGYKLSGLLSPRGEIKDENHRQYLDSVYQGDILNVDDWVKALDGVDAVVHLAGRSEESADALHLNVMSTHALVNACSITGVRKIVFASSNCVLGQCYRENDEALTLDYLPVDEQHRLMPCMDYGVSKQCAENVLQAASERFGLQSIALRLAWMLSDDECRDKVWSSLSEEIQVSSMWAYLHLDDALNAFSLAAEAEVDNQGGSGKGSFNALYLSAADTFSTTESALLAKKFYSHLDNSNITLSKYQSFYSWREAESVIGYVPQRSWQDFQ